jgi:beta-galactosidase/beta-glucuronidase
MYTRVNWCVEQGVRDKGRRPVILCEYAHAMGNSGGALGRYWEVSELECLWVGVLVHRYTDTSSQEPIHNLLHNIISTILPYFSIIYANQSISFTTFP